MKRYKLETVLIETTARCNLNCIFCGSDCKNILNPKELSVEEWSLLLDDFLKLGVRRVVLSGGEPTLKPGVEDLAAEIDSRGMEWGMVSNGFHIPRNFLNAIEKHKPYAVGLSLDGQGDTHNQLRGNPKSFGKLAENIPKFQKAGAPLTIITTVHKLNLGQLPYILLFVLENGIYGWQIQLAMPFGRMGERKELLLSQEEFLVLCSFIEEARKNFPFINTVGADCFAWARAGKIRDDSWPGCSGGLMALGIDSLGNVRGCLSMTGCAPEGNIRERSLIDIWNDPGLFSYNRRFDEKNLPELCSQCGKASLCKGGCNSQSFSMTNKFHQGVYCYYRSKNQRREKHEKQER